MAGMIINFITQLSKLFMIGAIIFLCCWLAYILYQKRERAKSLQMDRATNIVTRLIQFAGYLANKIKK